MKKIVSILMAVGFIASVSSFANPLDKAKAKMKDTQTQTENKAQETANTPNENQGAATTKTEEVKQQIDATKQNMTANAEKTAKKMKAKKAPK